MSWENTLGSISLGESVEPRELFSDPKGKSLVERGETTMSREGNVLRRERVCYCVERGEIYCIEREEFIKYIYPKESLHPQKTQELTGKSGGGAITSGTILNNARSVIPPPPQRIIPLIM